MPLPGSTGPSNPPGLDCQDRPVETAMTANPNVSASEKRF
jgi:hypothetical protein